MRRRAISRRALLRVLVTGPAALTLSACTRDNTPLPLPPVDPDAPIRSEVAADVRRLLAAYRATTERHPEEFRRLAPLMAEHRSHLRALGARDIRTASPSTGGATPTSSASATQTAAVPDNRRAARAALARAESQAATRQLEQLPHASAPVARMIASIGACQAAHAALLTRAT